MYLTQDQILRTLSILQTPLFKLNINLVLGVDGLEKNIHFMVYTKGRK